MTEWDCITLQSLYFVSQKKIALQIENEYLIREALICPGPAVLVCYLQGILICRRTQIPPLAGCDVVVHFAMFYYV